MAGGGEERRAGGEEAGADSSRRGRGRASHDDGGAGGVGRGRGRAAQEGAGSAGRHSLGEIGRGLTCPHSSGGGGPPPARARASLLRRVRSLDQTPGPSSGPGLQEELSPLGPHARPTRHTVHTKVSCIRDNPIIQAFVMECDICSFSKFSSGQGYYSQVLRVSWNIIEAEILASDTFQLGRDIEKFYELHQQLSMDDLARRRATHTRVCLVRVVGKVIRQLDNPAQLDRNSYHQSHSLIRFSLDLSQDKKSWENLFS